MCNLYTLAPWEVRNLIRHYTLIGRDFEEVMRGRNESLDVYPNRPAPVVIEQDGEHIVREDMLWGFPPFKPGAGYGTNFRSLKNHPPGADPPGEASNRGNVSAAGWRS
jgi:putative SOS response-associated peptidase YedK